MTTVKQERPALGATIEEAGGKARTWKPQRGDCFSWQRRHHYDPFEVEPFIQKQSRRIAYYITEGRKDSHIQVGDETIMLPNQLSGIIKEIEKSRYMLAFEDDWDDEGSPKYDPNTWKRAVHFLVDYSRKIYEQSGKVIQVPKIFHSVNGSIDLLWKNKQYQLLVNIPGGAGIAKFYGDNYDSNTVEGSFDPSNYSVGLMLTLLDQGNVAD